MACSSKIQPSPAGTRPVLSSPSRRWNGGLLSSVPRCGRGHLSSSGRYLCSSPQSLSDRDLKGWLL